MFRQAIALLAQVGPPGIDATDPQSLSAQYGPLFMTLGFAIVVAAGIFLVSSLAGRLAKTPSKEKDIPYESGSETTGARHVKLSVKFYLTALLFVVFDIESVFLYPWAVLYQRLGVWGFVEMLVFLVMLTIALVYCWKKGALEWET